MKNIFIGIFIFPFISVIGQSNCEGIDLDVNILGSDMLCQGDSTILDAGSYFSYLWSTGDTTKNIEVVSAGTYSVTVTDENGCTGSTSRTVTVLVPPDVNIFGSSSFCLGSSTTISASEGFTSYLWSTGESTPSIEIVEPGEYSVTVTDQNGCSGATSITVMGLLAPNLSITGSVSFCSNSSTIISASEGFTSYQWSTGKTTESIEVGSGGIYSVTVTDQNGCSKSEEIAIVELESVDPTINVSYGICTGELSIFNVGSYESILWSTGETTPSIEIVEPGEYSVTVTANGCAGTASINYILPVFDTIRILDTTYIEVIETVFDTVQVIDTTFISVTDTLFIDVNTTDINSVPIYSELKVYPNPSSEFIIVEIEDQIVLSDFNFEIMDISGVVVYQMLLTQEIFSIDVTDIGPPGTYFIVLRNFDGQQIENKTLILR